MFGIFFLMVTITPILLVILFNSTSLLWMEAVIFFISTTHNSWIIFFEVFKKDKHQIFQDIYTNFFNSIII